jgi:uncharacterized membrane protein
MAAIGFELRRLLKDASLLARLQLFLVAGAASSGPWVLSILGILLIGLLCARSGALAVDVTTFQVSVTYLMAGSLILTGPLQMVFTRFVADRLWSEQNAAVLPNLLGALTVASAVAGCFGLGLLALMPGVDEQSLLYWALMLSAFVILNNIWILAIAAAAAKEWQWLLVAFFCGYSVTVLGAYSLRGVGIEGLLVGFVGGHGLLLFLLLAHIARSYPSTRFIEFQFLRYFVSYPELVLIGLLYNLGVWVDKFVFWYSPLTGSNVSGFFRASHLYDFPLFVAYLSIVPGMAVFLLRVETDFSDKCARFFAQIADGATLSRLQELKHDIVGSARNSLWEVVKIQGITVLLLIYFSDSILSLIGVSPLYSMLLNIDLVAVGNQLVFLVVLNILFYLDKRSEVLLVVFLFFVMNLSFSLISQVLGPTFFGSGFAIAILLATVVGLLVLTRKMEVLEYETFMLQKPG